MPLKGPTVAPKHSTADITVNPAFFTQPYYLLAGWWELGSGRTPPCCLGVASRRRRCECVVPLARSFRQSSGLAAEACGVLREAGRTHRPAWPRFPARAHNPCLHRSGGGGLQLARYRWAHAAPNQPQRPRRCPLPWRPSPCAHACSLDRNLLRSTATSTAEPRLPGVGAVMASNAGGFQPQGYGQSPSSQSPADGKKVRAPPRHAHQGPHAPGAVALNNRARTPPLASFQPCPTAGRRSPGQAHTAERMPSLNPQPATRNPQPPTWFGVQEKNQTLRPVSIFQLKEATSNGEDGFIIDGTEIGQVPFMRRPRCHCT